MYGYIANLNEKFGNKRTTIYVKSILKKIYMSSQ